MIGSQDIRSLLREAMIAADPRSDGLLDRHDLQQFIKRLADVAEQLLVEREESANRLSRSQVGEPVPMFGNGYCASMA